MEGTLEEVRECQQTGTGKPMDLYTAGDAEKKQWPIALAALDIIASRGSVGEGALPSAHFSG